MSRLHPLVSVAAAHKRDAAPVGRPGRSHILLRRVLREVPRPAAVGVHGVDLAVAVAPAHEHDRPSVGRPGRSLHVERASACSGSGSGGDRRDRAPAWRAKPHPRRSLRRWRRPASARAAGCEVRRLASARSTHVVPVGDDRRNGEDPLERVHNFQLDVCHRTASSYERRSAACAEASVAETVPTSTSSAVAIDR